MSYQPNIIKRKKEKKILPFYFRIEDGVIGRQLRENLEEKSLSNH